VVVEAAETAAATAGKGRKWGGLGPALFITAPRLKRNAWNVGITHVNASASSASVSLRAFLEPAINGTDNVGQVERPNQRKTSWKNAAANKRVNRNNRTNNSVASSARLKSAIIRRARSIRTPT
jgi:hypothetical protein